ncbi:hypothetical protein Micbo1qcDRAFT_223168 [Microdochium bolleyi]|uniref:Carbohydrate esterase family 16 protein n=1 Tax=Microdochium bolleyi TaxID=196109 RepID=A0A136J8Y5_9PEZI|nr:hypothetical protein Micbo1qcDRAFT_223168 [Microdochium bolleyi]
MKLALTTLATLVAASDALATPPRAACPKTPNWTGLKNIKHAFIFGDSYTQTGFNFTQTPPSASNPLGNPPYPGWTSSNGPNWVGEFTVKYNVSKVLTYNLAYGGATVDSALIAPYTPTVLSLKDQINTEFVPGYTGASPSAPSAPKWTAKDSLFTIWIGINDVGTLFWQPDTTLFDKVFVEYAALVNTLYAKGARNIAFIDVPPMDRSPGYIEAGTWNVDQAKIAVAGWKSRMAALAKNLKQSKPDVNLFIYSSAADFGKALDNPAAFGQTAGLKVLDKYCKDYQNGTPAKDTFIAACGVPVNQYFWRDSIHPTYPIHQVVAEQFVKTLGAGPNVC